jgi:ATP-dependent Clp protease adaptor protein ClpS
MSTDTVIEKKKVTSNRTREPGKFKVIVCNDDVTTADFVVALLVTIFNHSEQSAVELTQQIHNSGSAVAGVYAYEIAEQKSLDGISLARANGFPLILRVAPE